MKQYYLIKPVCGATVVSWFISLHDYWFRDESNSFYCKREETEKFLLKLVDDATIVSPATTSNEMYLEFKFREWLESSWAVKGQIDGN